MAMSTQDKAEKETSSLPDSSLKDDSKDADSMVGDIDNLPKETKQFVKMAVQEFGMMGISHFSQENEVAKKINESHITNYLEGAREQMQNEYKERHEKKIFTVVLVFLALVAFIVIIILLKDKPEILEKIIYSVAGFVAGAFGGYGFGRRHSQDSD